jgi:hypothetical protein
LINLSGSSGGYFRISQSDVTTITVIGTIYMDDSESGSELISIDPGQRLITIRGKDNASPSEKAVITTRSGRVLSIKSSLVTSLKSKFKFENIEISGGVLSTDRDAGGGIEVSGNTEVTLGKGAVVTNNKAAQAGGISIMPFGTVIIDGGTITRNTINGNDLGGGVRVFHGTLIMSDGIISYNSGDGVTINERGSFIMTGGKIANNFQAGRTSEGVTCFGDFQMSGGTISENGSGVLLHSGTFTMTGGTIDKNIATGSSGGVGMTGGKFVMSNGTISNNSTGVIKGRNFLGGGVLISGGEFIMQGGIISGNYAIGAGGGVAVVENGEFTLQNGKIINNKSEGGGGGVMVFGGNFNMNGGEITGNADSSIGGGVAVSGGKFTKNGGIVTGNRAPQYQNIYQ